MGYLRNIQTGGRMGGLSTWNFQKKLKKDHVEIPEVKYKKKKNF